MNRIRSRGITRAPAPGSPHDFDSLLDWPQLLERLSVVRHRWDVAILVNLDEEQGTRSADLLAAVNSKAGDRQLSPQVLSVRMRALEHQGYVVHSDLSRIPLVRVYFLLPRGRTMLATLRGLAAWDENMPDRRSGEGGGRARRRAAVTRMPGHVLLTPDS